MSPLRGLLGVLAIPLLVVYGLVGHLRSIGRWVAGHALPLSLAVLAVTALVATGTVSTAEYLGPAGEPIDDAARSLGAFVDGVLVNVTAASNEPTESADGDQAAAAGGAGDTPASDTGFDRARAERRAHFETNLGRSNHGLSELRHDAHLRDIARQHSRAMAEAGYIYHDGPDGDLGDRFERAGYDCRVAVSSTQYAAGGENVAKTWYEERIVGGDYHDSPDDVGSGLVRQWMNSEGHRENILRPYWENEGIGIVTVEEDGKTAVYATQVFC